MEAEIALDKWLMREVQADGEGNDNPLHSQLENPMDRGAWQATVHGVTRVGHDLATKERERGRIEPKTPVDFYNVPRGMKGKIYPIQSGNLLGKASMVAQQSRICLQCRRCEFNPWVGKIPWRRKWQTTPVFLPKNSHGQRSLEGYCPRITESDTTEAT